MYQFGTQSDYRLDVWVSVRGEVQALEYRVRAELSCTASEVEGYFAAIEPCLTQDAANCPTRIQESATVRPIGPVDLQLFEHRCPQPSLSNTRGEGLLHDARNLVGTIGLYCDLLSMPGVLKPEHRQYPDELRLLGARSKSLIDHLMQSVFTMEDATIHSLNALTSGISTHFEPQVVKMRGPGWRSRNIVKPTSLRSIVDRCSGLLDRVANGRAIEITYGPAAAVLISVPEEAVERILVNLVRNAAAALGEPTSTGEPSEQEDLQKSLKPICILVGPIVSRVGEHKPWPFQQVRLVVEDAGRGMSPEQLEKLLCDNGTRSPGGHGIGFGVVRDLVAASDGEIRLMSEPEVGTRVQIEWPIAAMSERQTDAMDARNPPHWPPHSSQYSKAVEEGKTYQRPTNFRVDLRSELAS